MGYSRGLEVVRVHVATVDPIAASLTMSWLRRLHQSFIDGRNALLTVQSEDTVVLPQHFELSTVDHHAQTPPIPLVPLSLTYLPRSSHGRAV